MQDVPEKVYVNHTVSIEINHGSRRELRDTLITEFLKEDGGYVKDNKKYVQAYRYYVETLSNGKRIFLQRPAYLNKGMDFQVYVEDLFKFKNGKDKPPSHKSIIDDLKLKKSQNLGEFRQLLILIRRVWNCEDPNVVLHNMTFNFKEGLDPETLLKAIKWLFIEQDMTYWSFDGRDMLMSEIKKLQDN